MQRHELLAAMGELKLRGMMAAFDEAVVQGLRLRRSVEEILGDLVRAEAAERRSRSIRYRLGVAGLPVMKDLDDFRFDQSPVNEALVRSLYDGAFRGTLAAIETHWQAWLDGELGREEAIRRMVQSAGEP